MPSVESIDETLRLLESVRERFGYPLLFEKLHSTPEEIRRLRDQYMVHVPPPKQELAPPSPTTLNAKARMRASREIMKEHGFATSTPAELLWHYFGSREKWLNLVHQRTCEKIECESAQ